MPRIRRSSRDTILAAAADRFREVGPRSFTMSGVARVAGLTTPALYRHFKGKEELLSVLVSQGFELLTRCLARGHAGTTPRERFLLTSAAYLDFALDHPRHYETIFLTVNIPGLNRFPEDFQAGRSASFQMLVDRVRECIDTGVFVRGDPLEMSLSIWAQVHGFVTLALMGRFGNIAKNRGRICAHYNASVAWLFKGLNA